MGCEEGWNRLARLGEDGDEQWGEIKMEHACISRETSVSPSKAHSMENGRHQSPSWSECYHPFMVMITLTLDPY